jgi:hypothetical protein
MCNEHVERGAECYEVCSTFSVLRNRIKCVSGFLTVYVKMSQGIGLMEGGKYHIFLLCS